MAMTSMMGVTAPICAEDVNVAQGADVNTRQAGSVVLEDISSLKEVYKDYFKIGTAISTQDISEIDKAAIIKHFNSYTCGNEMKPDFLLDYDATVAYMNANKGDKIHPQISFKATDSALKFAAKK